MEEVSRYKVSDPSRFSRYRNLDRIVYEDGVEIQETPNEVNIKHTTGDQFYIVPVEHENRLDLIAYKFYNTPRLWWVVAYANKLDDPFNVPVGSRLRIPPYSVAISDEVV